MKADNVSVVLVEPQGPLNIGSICRVMMNFGFSDLRMVKPKGSHNGREARKMALKSDILIDNAKIFNSLSDALADCKYAVGTTRRYGKYREGILFPDQAADMVCTFEEETRIALVFGREDKGLLTEELDLCQHLITIPTHEDFASMNLAQSVAVCLYEMSKSLKNTIDHNPDCIKPCDGEKLEAMFQHMRKTLLDIDYSDPLSPDHIIRTFRRIFGRAVLGERDVRVLQGLWSRIDWIEGERKKRITQMDKK